MIRFIDLTNQIYPADPTHIFAWYDTVRSEFLGFMGFQVWDSWKEFSDDFALSGIEWATLERFRGLYPWSDKDGE